MAIVDGYTMKGKIIVTPFLLQKLIIQQLHSNPMGIQKKRLLVQVSILDKNNAYIEITIKQCATCLKYQQTKPHEETIMYEILCKPWKVVGADMSSINNQMLLCIVDYCSKFPIFKKADISQMTTWLKQLRLYLQKLDFQRKQFQMQTQTSYQTNLNRFAGKWTQIRPQLHHTTSRVMNRWWHPQNLWSIPSKKVW